MRTFLTLALGAAALASAPAMARAMPQAAPQQAPASQPDADAANAASMPDQGTDRALVPQAVEPRAYPLCSRTVTDECVNPREAGSNRGRVPLDYWPGRPASEMR